MMTQDLYYTQSIRLIMIDFQNSRLLIMSQIPYLNNDIVLAGGLYIDDDSFYIIGN